MLYPFVELLGKTVYCSSMKDMDSVFGIVGSISPRSKNDF